MTRSSIANAFGGVVVSGGGKVLLRQPMGHHAGYVWTFAKGRPNTGETPLETALREVREETGYTPRVIGPLLGTFAGTSGRSAFWLMDAIHPPVAFDAETQAIRWVNFAAAAALLSETRTPNGRARDLAILAAARQALDELPDGMVPAVQPDDWPLLPPTGAGGRRIPLDQRYDAIAMDGIARGYCPTAGWPDWFICCSGDRLHIYRSSTGHPAFVVYLVRDDRGGAWATEAIVHRDAFGDDAVCHADDRQQVLHLIETRLLDRGRHIGQAGCCPRRQSPHVADQREWRQSV